jgi:hypothetical protein
VPDDIDLSIATSIGLSNLLKEVSQAMWDAIRNSHQPVQVIIGGETVASFEKVGDELRMNINGRPVTYHHFT